MFVDKEMEIRDHAKWVKVRPSCGKDNGGGWWCVECAAYSQNNFGAMQHNDQHPSHHIVWHCGEHGFETTGKAKAASDKAANAKNKATLDNFFSKL